jgi:hypothetical protein
MIWSSRASALRGQLAEYSDFGKLDIRAPQRVLFISHPADWLMHTSATILGRDVLS